ncbi:flagellar hook assembly protein FlgD [Taklimakanibacter albus]|uniref:Flagellar hook assembly protein FlgD n=1 Tax=Taklimakanibacter albus TaxID=2800327 RepID=A0ACC5RAB8_9HYPH|nr:flagellar hook assembly protein FlgD [Aestuariivirga sp. YIM B02566]MBK1869626.1 flagellar hook assembly protein FlgD [Aestuariivirga sp. YIM B02566]
MQVNGTNSSNGGNTPPVPGSAAAATLDYNAFLRLLVAEMKNQDPTKPNDSTQYMAQLASFSNVEQAIKTNNKLDALLTTSALNQADGLIGRTITSADGAITGKVTAIKIIAGGAVAILEGDKQVPIEPGVVVKAS